MCSSLNLNRENSDFVDFLFLDIGSQVFREKMLSIHIETGNILFDNYNTNESIYDFLLRQQDETKKITHATLAYKDLFWNYLRYLQNNIDSETMENLIFLQIKMLNIFFTSLMTICYLMD